MHGSIYDRLLLHDVSRRDFLKFCSTMAGVLGLEAAMGPRIAKAIGKADKPSVVWLHFQECTGDTESFLRTYKPAAADIVLDILSIDYHETIMAPSGKSAEKSLEDAVSKGGYIAIVEGAIPMKDGGQYGCVGGKSMLEIARHVCGKAAAVINVGSCSAFGGIAAAKPNPTGAVSTAEAVPGITYINLPGCPVNVENITATVVHYLTFGSLPTMDSLHRPLFAYGKRIHDNCERRGHFDAGQFARAWGDEGHRQGWCLYELGCKGPASYMNCPTVKYNEGTSWPVQAGHPCYACGQPNAWDEFTPIYRRLEGIPGVNVHDTADKVGTVAVGAALAGVAVHAVGRAIKQSVSKKDEE
jgi:hydrogenase small subunit